MMRRPTPAARLYAHHSAAVRGEVPPVHDGMPECGWYKRRIVKGGPWVPVRIFVERDIDPETGELLGPERLVADVDGKRDDYPARHWTHLAPITRAEYDALIRRQEAIERMAATHAAFDTSHTPMRP